MKMLRCLTYVAAAMVATLISASSWAAVASFQELISDANGPNAAYNMEVGYMTSGFGGTLQANDANHQIGGLNGATGRAVLRWPINTLAGKGTITGATAKITFEPVIRAEAGAVIPNPFTYNLYRLTIGNNKWTDAGVGYARQLPAASPNPAVPWAGSQGAGTSGVDYFATPIAQATVTGGADITAKQVLTFNFTDISFLQDWVNNPGNNSGFLLRSEQLEAAGGTPNTPMGFAQGTMFPDDVTTAPGRYPGAVAADRPLLQITYTPIPEPQTFLMLLSGGAIALWRRGRRDI
jgi:PEP-CTERM motif